MHHPNKTAGQAFMGHAQVMELESTKYDWRDGISGQQSP